MSPLPALPAACGRVQGRLAELLDGGLAPLEAARDGGHLEVCPACGAERAVWLALVDGARRAGQADPAELACALAGLDARLAALVRPRPAAPWLRGALIPLATAAAALVALLALKLGGLRVPEDAGRLASLAPGLTPEVPALLDWSLILERHLGGGGRR